MKISEYAKQFRATPEGKSAEAKLAKDPLWQMDMAIFNVHLDFCLKPKKVVSILKKIIKQYEGLQ